MLGQLFNLQRKMASECMILSVYSAVITAQKMVFNRILHEKKRTVLEGHIIKRIKIYYGEYIPDQIKGKIFDKYSTHVADWYPTHVLV